jgi:hypothetical protein
VVYSHIFTVEIANPYRSLKPNTPKKIFWGFSSYLSTDQQLPALWVYVSLSFLICRLLSTYTHQRNRPSKLLLSRNLILLPLLKTSAVREYELIAKDYKSQWKHVCNKVQNQMISEQNRTNLLCSDKSKTRPYISGFPLDSSAHTRTPTHTLCM